MYMYMYYYYCFYVITIIIYVRVTYYTIHIYSYIRQILQAAAGQTIREKWRARCF